MEQYLPIILPLVWAAILAFSVFLYVMLDGFDLGLGALFLIAPSDADRDAMMHSVAPFWDGNETWLVLGGVGLLAAFPLAYSVLLPALYLPITLMLMGLILRGVAFEFRFKEDRRRWIWDWAFAGGSLLAALMQGLILGAFIQGFQVVDRKFVGGSFDWLTPFAILTALALVSGYILLAAGWLLMKGADELRAWAAGVGRVALIATGIFAALVSLWTPLLHQDVADRWFSPANMVMLSPVPLLTAAAAYFLWRSLNEGGRYMPFVLSAALFVLGYTGLAVSLFPFIIPPDVTIWDASSSVDAQLFLLYGTIPILPIIVGYSAYSYYALWNHSEGDASAYH
jgi:cytochrome d ubiquinol oxidase subunit II